ncbi:MAG: 5-oxoprolinase subunit PxpA [Pseudomonadota bacterium]
MTGTIDLNADLGEGCAYDAEILALVSSCSIACGGHAGDAATMDEALARASEAGVACGAHPGFPDKEHFGRRHLDLPAAELRSSLREQLEAIADVAARRGVPLAHVKPHGALYHAADQDAAIAAMIVELAGEHLDSAAAYGPPGGALERAAHARGIRFVSEGFADRLYQANGKLTPRSEQGAVIADANACAAQALSIAREGRASLSGGTTVAVPVRTICLHGDKPEALANARAVRAALDRADIRVERP